MSDYRLKHYLQDHNGEVIWTYDVFLWAEWFQWAYRHVDQTEVGPYRVSTVFIGVDQNHWGTGPPILWETMVFGPDSWEDRWQTRDEASKRLAAR